MPRLPFSMARRPNRPYTATREKPLHFWSGILFMNGLAITYRDPQSLKPSPSNSRAHSDKQIRQVARSIRSFGFLTPVLIDADDVIVVGHCRTEAAKSMRLDAIPTVRVEHLTDAQKRAFMIADNRLG